MSSMLVRPDSISNLERVEQSSKDKNTLSLSGSCLLCGLERSWDLYSPFVVAQRVVLAAGFFCLSFWSLPLEVSVVIDVVVVSFVFLFRVAFGLSECSSARGKRKNTVRRNVALSCFP